MNEAIAPVTAISQDSIPEWVMNLLWFKDGPYKNLERNPTIDNTGREEPSAISLNWPISPVEDINSVPKPKYYPSYRELRPDQRWVYLNWLKDPLAEIDVGYVFVFYYGLERHLLHGGKYEAAFDAIQTLRAVHHKIDNYAFEALSVSAILRGDRDRYIRLIENHEPSYWPTYLAGKRHFGVGLTSEEIIKLAGSVGFKNRRYINSEYAIFLSTLNKTLLDDYGLAFLPLETIDISNCPKVASCYLANYSIAPEIREYRLFNIIDQAQFKKIVFQLLERTHGSVKELLKEQRLKFK